jgi:hypothetical protein
MSIQTGGIQLSMLAHTPLKVGGHCCGKSNTMSVLLEASGRCAVPFALSDIEGEYSSLVRSHLTHGSPFPQGETHVSRPRH